MAKVGTIVKDALDYLGVTDVNEAPEAEDMTTGIRQLNMMLRRWEANHLSLGWQEVSNPDEELQIPPEAEEAVGLNLAVALRARYKIPIGEIQDVFRMAKDGYNALLRDQAVATPIKPILDAPEPDHCGANTLRGTVWYF